MKNLYMLLTTWVFITAGLSQTTPLYIQQEGGKIFLNHKVVPKENWYSIGRLYNASPKEVAPFNNTTMEKGLTIGQSLKIPLNSANFTQSAQPAGDEVVVPVYHKVKEKEGLFRIGQTYNKVSVEQLRSWNKLSSNEISTGMNLVVGYLKVKKSLSAYASAGKPRIQDVIPDAGQTVAAAPQEKAPVAEVKKEARAADPVTVAARGTETKPAETKPAETKPAESRPVDTPPAQRAEPIQTSSTSTEGGAFRGLFEEQARSTAEQQTVNGQGAIFKSTSGWKDSKYYALMNKVLPGTIVRVVNPSTKRYVYAKVLGELQGRDNEGLAIRISNAAAAELGLPESGRHELQLSWMQN